MRHKIKVDRYPQSARVVLVDGNGKEVFGYDADVLPMGHEHMFNPEAKIRYGVNWGGIGTQEVKDVKWFIEVLQVAKEVAEDMSKQGK